MFQFCQYEEVETHCPFYLGQWWHTHQQNIMTSLCAFVSLIQTDEAQQSESFSFIFYHFRAQILCAQ